MSQQNQKKKKVPFRPKTESAVKQGIAARKAELNELTMYARELDLMIAILSANAALSVGAGRIEKLLQEYRIQSDEVFSLLCDDGADDKKLAYSTKVLADRLKKILGKDNWIKYRNNFPLLKDEWEVE